MRSAVKSSLLVLPALLLGSAVAADSPPPDLLRGPTVTTSARAVGLPMLSTGAQVRAIRRQAVPVRRWFTEFSGLPLDEEQRVRFATLKKDFKARADEYKSEHGKTLSRERKELQRLVGQRDTPIPERGQETMRRVQELKSNISQIEFMAPKVQDLQMACWNLLTAEQQDLFRVELKVIRDKLRADKVHAEEQRRRDTMQEPDAMQETPK